MLLEKILKKSVLSLALACAVPGMAMADIKIGFLGTLSGPSAANGRDQLDGFRLALEQLDGKLGGVDTEIVAEDDQMKPSVALTGVSRLLEREEVDAVVGLTFTHVLMALQPKIAETDVPFIGTISGPSPTAGALCKPNLFIMSWQSDAPAEAMGKYMQDKGVKSISTLTPNFVGGKDKISGLRNTYKGEIIDEIYTPLSQLDFSAELTQVAVSDPEGVFMFYPGGLGVTFMRQYKQAGLAGKLPLYTANSIEGEDVDAMGEAVIGAYAADTWTPGISSEYSKQFVNAYREKYNRTPSAYAAFSYDAMMKLNAAVEALKGDVSDKKAFVKAIKTADFESVRGDFKFGNNNYPVQNYHIFEMVEGENGKPDWKLVQENVLKDHVDSYAAQCPMS